MRHSDGVRRELFHRRAGFFQTFAAIALVAMLVRALVPAGYMLAPAPGDDYAVAVVLCSGHGPLNAIVDLRTGKLVEGESGAPADTGKRGEEGSAQCAFTASPSVAIVPSSVSLPLTPCSKDIEPALTFVEAIAATSLLTPWSTGPPRSI